MNLATFPLDVLTSTFKWLPLPDLQNCYPVCRRLRFAADEVLKEVCLRRFEVITTNPRLTYRLERDRFKSYQSPPQKTPFSLSEFTSITCSQKYYAVAFVTVKVFLRDTNQQVYETHYISWRTFRFVDTSLLQLDQTLINVETKAKVDLPNHSALPYGDRVLIHQPAWKIFCYRKNDFTYLGSIELPARPHQLSTLDGRWFAAKVINHWLLYDLDDLKKPPSESANPMEEVYGPLFKNKTVEGIGDTVAFEVNGCLNRFNKKTRELKEIKVTFTGHMYFKNNRLLVYRDNEILDYGTTHDKILHRLPVTDFAKIVDMDGPYVMVMRGRGNDTGCQYTIYHLPTQTLMQTLLDHEWTVVGFDLTFKKSTFERVYFFPPKP